MSIESASAPPIANPTEDRTVAIVSYLTLIGFIVAVVVHPGKKTALGAFHLRQTLGIIILAFAAGLAAAIVLFIPFIGWLAAFAIYMALLAAWLHGLIMAATGRQEPIPVIGPKFQELFKGAFV